MKIFSGIQPTGRKHLGNYIGAIAQFVELQEKGDPAIFCVVDLHAITVTYDPPEFRERFYDTLAILLAAGLDPEKCILFRQSDVPEHTELTWMLAGAATAYGDLNRMTQFKEKSPKQKEMVSAGLYFYPVLMAADILAYNTRSCPRGGRSASAPRTRARNRNEVQQSLRRDVRRARVHDPGGRRANHGSAGADEQDVDDVR